MICIFELAVILVWTFADDTKIGRIIRSDSDAIALQADLDRMNEWTDRWQMQFIVNKFKV